MISLVGPLQERRGEPVHDHRGPEPRGWVASGFVFAQCAESRTLEPNVGNVLTDNRHLRRIYGARFAVTTRIAGIGNPRLAATASRAQRRQWSLGRTFRSHTPRERVAA